tara:strand:- start:16 stop:573 length:558 start_codon:yes stop_codon:yes gene_type:complete
MYKDYEIKLKAILDSHKGVKRFDFKDIKTLDKLTGQLKSLVSKLDDSKIKSEIGNYDKVNAEFKVADKNRDTAEESISKSKEKIKLAEKELETEFKLFNNIDKKRATVDKKKEASAKKVFNENDKYISTYNKAESISNKLEDAIELVEKSAKDIGLSVNVAQYETQVNNFNKLVDNPLNKLDFDY